MPLIGVFLHEPMTHEVHLPSSPWRTVAPAEVGRSSPCAPDRKGQCGLFGVLKSEIGPTL